MQKQYGRNLIYYMKINGKHYVTTGRSMNEPLYFTVITSYVLYANWREKQMCWSGVQLAQDESFAQIRKSVNLQMGLYQMALHCWHNCLQVKGCEQIRSTLSDVFRALNDMEFSCMFITTVMVIHAQLALSSLVAFLTHMRKSTILFHHYSTRDK